MVFKKGRTSWNKGKKFVFLLLFFILFINLGQSSLGVYKVGDCVDIKTILNTSAVTISSLNYPDSSRVLGITEMEKNGLTFNYTFCNTSNLGTYNYDYNDTEGNVYVNDFIIKSGSNDSSITLFIFLYILFYGITIFGLIRRHEWITLGGCFGLLIIGIYTGTNGFDIYKNGLTSAISYITLLIGLGLGFETLYEITTY